VAVVRKSRPLICGESAAVTPRLLEAALRTPAGERGHPYEVPDRLVCLLERHDSGPHRALVRMLDNATSGELWTSWLKYPPWELSVLPDCNILNGRPSPQDEACVLFAGHPGLHTFETVDPHDTALRRSAEFHLLKAYVDRLIPTPGPHS
jgi:hypothetical protein